MVTAMTSDSVAILTRGPVIPVTTMLKEADAVAIGEALLAGGLSTIEITLRSAAGLPAIESLRLGCPDLCVGAGTVWTRDQAAAAANAGAQFIVSPGAADGVFDVCAEIAMPYLPGAQTVSEMVAYASRGARAVKFFPASTSGGAEALKAFASVLPDLLFCPTGGITLATARDYLALDCVPCVGGGWVTPASVLSARDWRALESAARQAAALAPARA
jgi:2-dehydro-3-deoxyphosphogluconate aldolase / (4S)-4-hydroxy-2-oxoglutarate aldolase